MGGNLAMIKKMGVLLLLLAVAVVAPVIISGCSSSETETEQQVVLNGEGVWVGLIDSHSAEIEVGGVPGAFALSEDIDAEALSEGTKVVFTYVEEETRPLILTIDAVEQVIPTLTAEGIYNGQIDSHSVEIEVGGETKAFAIGEDLSLEGLESGAVIEFTYREEEHRPIILSIDSIELPAGGDEGELVGEGILVGLIDAQSVEIQINRAFILADDISVDDIDNIEDGSLVAFSFMESGQRAVIESIRAVDEPVEGNFTHGTFIGWIDSQSIEIEYFQAFAIGEADLQDIADGSSIVFTYILKEYRPELISVTAR
jgi:Cu/Ag efflux protein CusF